VCRLEPGEEACQRAWGRLALCQFLAIFWSFLTLLTGVKKKILVFLADFPDFPPFLMLFGALSFLKMAWVGALLSPKPIWAHWGLKHLRKVSQIYFFPILADLSHM
jgi:hypothetical protein